MWYKIASEQQSEREREEKVSGEEFLMWKRRWRPRKALQKGDDIEKSFRMGGVRQMGHGLGALLGALI